MQVVLKAVTAFERHHTYTEYHLSIAVKLFLALFLNTALTVLIVNAKLKDSKIPAEVGVFGGEFTNFVPRWFSGTLLPFCRCFGSCCRAVCILCFVCVSRGEWMLYVVSSVGF